MSPNQPERMSSQLERILIILCLPFALTFLPDTSLQGTALPSTGLPGTSLPGTGLSGNSLPGPGLPGSSQSGTSLSCISLSCTSIQGSIGSDSSMDTTTSVMADAMCA